MAPSPRVTASPLPNPTHPPHPPNPPRHLGIPVSEEAERYVDDVGDLHGGGATVVPISERQGAGLRMLH